MAGIGALASAMMGLPEQARDRQLQYRGDDCCPDGEARLKGVAEGKQGNALQWPHALAGMGCCNMVPSIAARTLAASLEGNQGSIQTSVKVGPEGERREDRQRAIGQIKNSRPL